MIYRYMWLRAAGCALAILCVACTMQAQENVRCSPTQSDYLGPYYVSGMPVVENMNRFGKPGEPLQVTGFVRSAAPGYPPLVGARIEVWQTDGVGAYHPHGNGRRTDYDDSDLDMRGTVISGAGGRFDFLTVTPGIEGRGSRPRHFHYRISAAGHRTLVTQHYVRENGSMPGGICRSAAIERAGGRAHFPAPAIYLQPQ